MCTLTFIPKAHGYLLGMNRDELRNREIARAPEVQKKGALDVVFPRESGGGTWIGANSVGIGFALMNRNSRQEVIKQRTRGDVIPAILRTNEPRHAVSAVFSMDPFGMLPFSLVGIFPMQKVIYEWQWDGRAMRMRRFLWWSHHWFSSGLSDEEATRTRNVTCYEAWRKRNAGSKEWLRGLHASHLPEQGAFSICVHRPDASTVSYTEIAYTGHQLAMRYHRGNPCEGLGQFDREIVIATVDQSLREPGPRAVNQ